VGGWRAGGQILTAVGRCRLLFSCCCQAALHPPASLASCPSLQGVANVAEAAKELGGKQHVVLVSSCLVRCGCLCWWLPSALCRQCGRGPNLRALRWSFLNFASDGWH
jgi:hypothetical protein